ncbi:MAG: XRE family transcriptional regulator [Oscillospiraceae bacterium]|nr:XRE family transcriptional regulator [Oscillospiraceae bacterium]
MLSNLKAEMVRANITVAEIASLSGKSCRTISDRIKGKGQFPIQEAINVKNTFFPTLGLEYLFASRTQSADAQDSA